MRGVGGDHRTLPLAMLGAGDHKTFQHILLWREKVLMR